MATASHDSLKAEDVIQPFKQLAMIVAHPMRAARFGLSVRHPVHRPPLLAPSIGRVGSTLLWNALVESRIRATLGTIWRYDRRLVARQIWDLTDARFEAGTIIKTHDFPDSLDPAQPLRIVFLFGRPSDVVLSVLRCRQTRGPAWIAEHLRHLHANEPLDSVLDRDVLRIEDQLTAWLAYRGHDTLSLRYDALWAHQRLLGEFVGFPVTLPERKERTSSDLDPALVARVRNAYATLDAQTAALPDHQLRRAST